MASGRCIVMLQENLQLQKASNCRMTHTTTQRQQCTCAHCHSRPKNQQTSGAHTNNKWVNQQRMPRPGCHSSSQVAHGVAVQVVKVASAIRYSQYHQGRQQEASAQDQHNGVVGPLQHNKAAGQAELHVAVQNLHNWTGIWLFVLECRRG
jgi:hypothetical protein